MRYSFEFKVKCVEMYERGEYPDTPNGISTRKFKDTIRKWKRMVDALRVGVLRHKIKSQSIRNKIKYFPYASQRKKIEKND